jgi:hypothetical protein
MEINMKKIKVNYRIIALPPFLITVLGKNGSEELLTTCGIRLGY